VPTGAFTFSCPDAPGFSTMGSFGVSPPKSRGVSARSAGSIGISSPPFNTGVLVSPFSPALSGGVLAPAPRGVCTPRGVSARGFGSSAGVSAPRGSSAGVAARGPCGVEAPPASRGVGVPALRPPMTEGVSSPAATEDCIETAPWASTTSTESRGRLPIKAVHSTSESAWSLSWMLAAAGEGTSSSTTLASSLMPLKLSGTELVRLNGSFGLDVSPAWLGADPTSRCE